MQLNYHIICLQSDIGVCSIAGITRNISTIQPDCSSMCGMDIRQKYYYFRPLIINSVVWGLAVISASRSAYKVGPYSIYRATEELWLHHYIKFDFNSHVAQSSIPNQWYYPPYCPSMLSTTGHLNPSVKIHLPSKNNLSNQISRTGTTTWVHSAPEFLHCLPCHIPIEISNGFHCRSQAVIYISKVNIH